MGAPRWVRLGRAVRVQGLRGEFRIDADSGDPEVFTKLKQLAWSQGGEPVAVVAARTHKRQAVVKVAGVESVEAAETLIGREVWVRREWMPPAPKGAYYWVDLVGCKVVDAAGAEVGDVAALEDYGPHGILVVTRPGGGEGLIPFVESIVTGVDLEARKVTVDPPPGLLD